MFNAEVSVGNLVAAGAVLISAAAVLTTIAKERALKMKELADRVRQSAALVAAKLDRWKQLAVQSFDQLQTAATDADGHLIEKNSEVLTRDMFWKNIVSTQSELMKRVLDEEIEVAYSNLFGYDPKVHDLYTGAVDCLRSIQMLVFLQLLNRTQAEILTIRNGSPIKIKSAQLGNKLRYRLGESRTLLENQMESVVKYFRDAMSSLVRASDEDLVSRNVKLPDAGALPDLASLAIAILSKEDDATLLDFDWQQARNFSECQRIFSKTQESALGSQMLDPWPHSAHLPCKMVFRGRA